MLIWLLTIVVGYVIIGSTAIDLALLDQHVRERHWTDIPGQP